MKMLRFWQRMILFKPIINSLDNLPGVSIIVFDRRMKYRLARGGSIHAQGYKNLEGTTLYELAREGENAPNKAAIAVLLPLYKRALAGEHFSILNFKAISDPSKRYHLYFFPVYWKYGRVEMAAVAIQDITDQERLAETLVKVKAEQDTSYVLSAIAQRFGAMAAEAREIENDLTRHQAGQVIPARLSDLISRAMVEIRDLVLLSGVYALHIERVNIGEIIQEMKGFEQFSAQIESNIFFDCDRAKISRAIQELMNNALKHDPKPKIRVSPGQLEIENQGHIDTSKIKPFKSTTGGRGVGFSLAKALLQKQGAKLTTINNNQHVVVSIQWETP